MSLKTVRLPIALWLAAVAAAQAQTPAAARPELGGFDAYIGQAIRDWEVPGLAVAVVRGDTVLWIRGFGVRELGGSEPVDENTVFLAASTTKAFTAAAMAMLVDSGRVRWDDRVGRHLPGFRVADPYITAELTIRDLLSHRSGFSRADALWYGTTYGREEIVRRLQFQEPSWSFRSRYGYNNNMFITAGEVIEAVSGRSWEQFIRERLLVPLGMTRTTTSVASLQGMPNVATPHARRDGRMVTIRWRNVDNVGAAGAINSTVSDMSRWVRLQLAGGEFAGRRLISAAAVREMRLPNTPIRPEPRTDSIYPEVHLRSYGLGWVLSDYRGRLVVSHGGALDGMRAQVALMPEERLGVVLMANSNQAATLLVALQYRLFDAFTGGVRRDWSADLLAALHQDRARAQQRERERDSARVRDTRPSRPPSGYTGHFADSLYGTVEVREEAGRLVLQVGSWATGNLEHWHYDVFRITWRDRELGRDFVSFLPGFDGRIMRMEIEDLAVFGRVEERRP